MSEKPPDIWNLKYFDQNRKVESLGCVQIM